MIDLSFELRLTIVMEWEYDWRRDSAARTQSAPSHEIYHKFHIYVAEEEVLKQDNFIGGQLIIDTGACMSSTLNRERFKVLELPATDDEYFLVVGWMRRI